MNKVIEIGRTTKAIELKKTTSGVSVAEFSIAVKKNFKNANGEYESDFFNCVAYRTQAETLSKYVNKGDLIGIEGRLQTRNYTDKNGHKVYVTEIIVDNVEFLQNKKDKQEQTEERYDADPFGGAEFTAVDPDEDLPF